MTLELDFSLSPHKYFTPTLEERTDRAQHYCTLAALIFLVCDYVSTSSYEFVHIWRRPVTMVKVIYVFSRYYGLLFQLINLILLVKILCYIPIPQSLCYNWYIFQVISFWLLFSAMDAILMLRVYALYDKSQYVSFGLILLFVFETALAIICSIRILAASTYDAICYSLITPREALVFGAGILFSQIVIALLTIAKRNTGQSADDKLVRTVLYDGIWVFAGVSALFSFMIPYSFLKQVVRPFIVFALPNSLFPFIACRLIMNIHQPNIKVDCCLPQRYTGHTPSTIELPPMLGSSNTAVADPNVGHEGSIA